MEKGDRMKQTLYEDISLVFLGGSLYYLIEILWRGFSHVSMFFCGGCCFLSVGKAATFLKGKVSLFMKMLVGTAIITSLEFLTGVIVNIWMKLNVWDYSDMPGNLFGQICLQYSIFWFFLTIPCMKLYDWVRENVFSV